MGANRWWYFAATVIMAIAVAAFYVGIKASAQTPAGYIVPGVVVSALLLGAWGYRMRIVDTAMARHERSALLAAAALSVVTILLHAIAVPDGLSTWTVLTGVLPALPFLLVAGRSQRVLKDGS